MFTLNKYASIKTKILGLVLTCTFCLIFLGGINIKSAVDQFLEAKQIKTRSAVESCYSLIMHFHALQMSGEMSEGAAKLAAINAVKALRYEGSNYYFWINNLSKPFPTMIMHPTESR